MWHQEKDVVSEFDRKIGERPVINTAPWAKGYVEPRQLPAEKAIDLLRDAAKVLQWYAKTTGGGGRAMEMGNRIGSYLISKEPEEQGEGE